MASTGYSLTRASSSNLNISSFNHTRTTDNQICRSILQAVEQDCQIPGFYCPNITNNYEIDGYISVHDPQFGSDPMPLVSTNINCTNQLLRNLCPKGFYCPNSKAKIVCPRGHYCGLGFVSPHLCEWLTISCPWVGMDSALWYSLLLSYCAVLLIGLSLQYYCLRASYQKQRRCRENHSFELRNSKSIIPGVGQLLEDSEMNSKTQKNDDLYATTTLSDQRTRDEEEAQMQNETDQFQFSKISRPLTVYFDKLSLFLPEQDSQRFQEHSERRILDEVFGCIKPFEITCILGPTGAGKTTLLNVLRGQVFSGSCTGRVMVNGKEISSLHLLSSQVAFVPQSDVLYQELTVEDNIMYAALLFNKRGWSAIEEVLPMVDRIEHLLGLDQVRFQVVGSEGEKDRVSGGQRKRVSIGMELVKEAPLLLLDEPTSGLDAATSISLIYALKELARLGVNIVATLHQPRYEILEVINSVIVLAPGGRVAYQGSIENLRNYLMRFGYECPLHVNIADYVMDCLAGLNSNDDIPEAAALSRMRLTAHIESICYSWKTENYPVFKYHVLSEEADVAISFVVADGRVTNFISVVRTAVHTAYVCFIRQQQVYFQTFFLVLTTCCILFLSGIAVGKLENPVRIENYIDAPGIVISQTSFSQLVFGIFSSSSALQLFANDEDMRQREEAGGVCLVGLFLGKLAASYIEWLFFSFAFLSGYYSVIRSNTSFFDYWCVFSLLHVSISGLSNVMAIVVPKRVKNLMTLGSVVLLWLLGGIQPTNDKIPSVLPVVGPLLNAVSPFRWSFELQVTQETAHYSRIFYPLVQRLLMSRGYLILHASHDRWMLLLYWLLYNLAAVCLLVAKRDNCFAIRSIVGEEVTISPSVENVSGEEAKSSEVQETWSSRNEAGYIEII